MIGLPEDLTDEEFLELIATMDPAHRVLARIERAKQLMRAEQSKEKSCSGLQSLSASSF